ncbi:MAG: hypothetical protein HPY89_00395 [Pelotomaculum sp.]|nr:hypothetical protein [Pelotomaculum sp.]
MQEAPDVIGFPLYEALEKCSSSGFSVEIVFTMPVETLPAGEPRVVRFNKVSNNKMVLTVVFENRERGGG